MATAIDGVSTDQAIDLARQLEVDRLLDSALEPRPWMVAEPASIEHALHCVRNVASVLPFRVTCLEETTAAMLFWSLKIRELGGSMESLLTQPGCTPG